MQLLFVELAQGLPNDPRFPYTPLTRHAFDDQGLVWIFDIGISLPSWLGTKT